MCQKRLHYNPKVGGFYPLLHAHTSGQGGSFYFMADLALRAGTGTSKGREEHYHPPSRTSTSVSFLQAGTKILFLKTPTTPLEAQAPDISEMHNFRLHSSASSQAAPNLLRYLHQPPLKAGFHLTQLTHPPATTQQVRGRDSSTESLKERHTPHEHRPQNEAPVSSCIFLSWEDLTIKTCNSDKHKSLTQCISTGFARGALSPAP